MYSEQQTKFGRDKHLTLPRQCTACKWLFACNGECPKNRLLNTADGEPGLNYLCEGYRMYFEHVAPYMEYMKKQLQWAVAYGVLPDSRILVSSKNEQWTT